MLTGKKKMLWIYLGFFAVLLTAFLFFTLKDHDFSRSKLAVISNVPAFRFTNQDGKIITQNDTDDKVYVAEYFFTTCRGICPKMNANMRRVYNEYKHDRNFLILSHTCMPETDSVHVLKEYEQKMIKGKLVRSEDGSHTIKEPVPPLNDTLKNRTWHFLTGDKESLYKMARQGYMIDNGKPDSAQNIKDQFIHTQFFALVDKHRRVRGIYDGLIESEILKLQADIKELLEEKITTKRFMNGFSNNPQ
jgi:protein SCO1/2